MHVAGCGGGGALPPQAFLPPAHHQVRLRFHRHIRGLSGRRSLRLKGTVSQDSCPFWYVTLRILHAEYLFSSQINT
jgi:hypothetical protein